MSLANILGKGVMPQFSMRGNTSTPFTNVRQDMLNTAATGEAMRQSISDKYFSDVSAFTDGTAALKDIFGTKEPSIEDLFSDSATEEEDLAFDVNLPINDAPLTYSDAGLTEVPSGSVPEEDYGLLDFGIDTARYSIFPFLSALTEPTVLADGTLYGDDFENAPPEFFEGLDYVDDYADGGRVHKGFGGIMNNLSKIIPGQGQQQMQQTFTPNRFAYAYSPFMDAQQGFDYYTQFQAPTYPIRQAVPVPNVPGEGEDRGFSNITLPVEPGNSFINEKKDFGTLSGPVKGGGENRPLSRFEANPTEMGFNDQGKLVYTKVNPYTKNVKVGDEVPFVSPIAYGLGYLADKTTQFLENKFVPESFKNIFSKKKTDAKPKVTFNPATISKIIDEAPATPTGKVDPKKAKEVQDAIAQEQNKYEGNIGKVKGQPYGGFTANQISKGKLVGYGFDPKTGKYKGAVQTKHGPLVSDPTKNKKLQALKNKFGKNKNNKGGNKGGNQGGKQGQSRCFVKGTMVEMADGTTKEITTITPGMETRGGTVEFVLQGLPVDIWDYKGVKVSGTHWVVEDNQLIAVEDSKHGIKTDMFEPVYSMKTSKQRMWIKGIEFGDFESGTDEDWEPYFEKVRQDLNKKLHEKRKENQQSDERV
jgi:hypothetical protein